MSGFFERVFIGMLVSVPVTCVVAGSVQDGLLLMLMSIICTAGIGLVVWIPLWWFVGWIMLLVFQALTSGFPGQDGGKQVPYKSNDQVLSQYIRTAMENGMDMNGVMSRLQRNGWTREEVESAYQGLISSASVPHEP